MAITARMINTTITKYIRKEVLAMLRNRKLWAILNDRGRITFNNSGAGPNNNDFDWKVQYRQVPMTPYSDGQTLTFAPQNLWKSAALDYRGYTMQDSIGILEKLKNKNDEAIIKVFDDIAMRMMTSAKDKLGEELYVDGNAAANLGRFHGFESFLSATAGSAGAKVAVNNDSYAGLSTVLGAYASNSWNGTWPTGTGDSEIDFWTPLVVDYTNTGFAATSPTWRVNCIEALRFGITKAKKNVNKDGAIDLVMMTDDMYIDFKNAEDDKTQNRISRDDGSSGLWKLGFRDIMNLDGVDCTYEYGVPADTGYGLPMGVIEMMSLQDDLIKAKEVFWDINSLVDKFVLLIFGNLKFEQIRNFVKWKNVT